jgi:hypothetical protein
MLLFVQQNSNLINLWGNIILLLIKVIQTLSPCKAICNKIISLHNIKLIYVYRWKMAEKINIVLTSRRLKIEIH